MDMPELTTETTTVLLGAGALAVVILLGAVAAYLRHRRATNRVRHGLRLELAMPPAAVIGLAASMFPEGWADVPGDGAINRRPADPEAPGVSVYAVQAEDGGSEVHLWMSTWSHRFGLVRRPRVASAQLERLSSALVAADEAYVAPAQHRHEAERQLFELLGKMAA